MIREGQHLVADDLTGFVALASDDQDIARAEHGHARSDRLCTVADLACAGGGGEDFGTDRLTIDVVHWIGLFLFVLSAVLTITSGWSYFRRHGHVVLD